MAVFTKVYISALAVVLPGFSASSQFSAERGNASAVIYTMVEMTKVQDLNDYGYLKFLLNHQTTKEMTDDQLAEFAP